jgi:hypothetical protein
MILLRHVEHGIDLPGSTAAIPDQLDCFTLSASGVNFQAGDDKHRSGKTIVGRHNDMGARANTSDSLPWFCSSRLRRRKGASKSLPAILDVLGK